MSSSKNRTSLRGQLKYDIVIEWGGACSDCKIDLRDHLEIADFDHVRGVKLYDISGAMQHAADAPGSDLAYVRLREELSKCDLVCANCHRTRTLGRMADKEEAAPPEVQTVDDPKDAETAPDLVRRAPWYTQVLCACGCGIAFSEEPRVGRPKRYIDDRHAKRVAMRTYRHRVKEGARIWEDRQCRRYVPKSLAEAETAFRLHCEYGRVGTLHCTKALPKTSLRCPAVFHKDYECQGKLCIAYGTLFDDLMEWKMQGRYQRRFTSMDGFWLSDMEKADARNPLPKKTDEPWEDPSIYTS